MRVRRILSAAISAFGIFAPAPLLLSQELPKPTYQNAVIVSIEHSPYDSPEVDYIKSRFKYGLYAWPSLSVTHIGLDLGWHEDWGDAAGGIQGFMDSVDSLIAAAKARNVKLHFVVCSGLARGLWVYREAKEEDIRNASWYNDNKLAADSQLFEPGGMDTYVFGTFSRYARKLRANLEPKAKAALAFIKRRMDENPDTLLVVSGWGEAEMNYHRISDGGIFYFCDYSPFAVLEFRDWVQHAGMYDDAWGRYAGQGYSGGGAKYQGAAGLAQFNADFGTSFSSWDLRYYNWSLGDDYDPLPQDYVNRDPHRIPFGSYAHGSVMPAAGPDYIAGGFDPPRTLQPGDAFWELWMDFRESLVEWFVRDMARWAAETGISAERWFSHQFAADCLFGLSPDSPFQGERYYSSGSPIRTAGIAPFGSAGATVYDIKFPAELYPPVYARTSTSAFPLLASMSPNWGIVEYDAESYPVGYEVSPSGFEFIAEQYLQAYNLGVHFINFWRWIDETPEHTIKGTNKELALAQFIGRIRDKARSTNPALVYAPPKVTGLTGTYTGAAGRTEISGKIWSDAAWDWNTWGDFSHFEIYRGGLPGFAADPAHYLGRTNACFHEDSGVAAGNLYYYKWLAVNVDGVKGPASDEVRVAAAAGPSVVVSGAVKTAEGNGINEVAVTFSNGGGTAVTDATGAYAKLLGSGWSGVLTPSKTGYVFNPVSRALANVTADRGGEDFAGSVAVYTISGTVRLGSGVGLDGVVLNGLPGNPATDAAGRFAAEVTHGWSGSAIPTKTGFSFSPVDRNFAGVASDVGGQDFSATFTPNTITVTSPNGGENWVADSSHPITWTTSGTVGNVKIDYSIDNGQTWTTISASAPNTGTLSWTVPSAATTNGLVRVSQAAGGTPLDVSDGRFSITVPVLTTIVFDKNALRFGATTAGVRTRAQKFLVKSGSGGILNWAGAVAGTPSFIQAGPLAGTGNGVITVNADPAGLAPGTYTGRVTVSDPNATNSPQTVSVALTVLDAGATEAPFGVVETPADGAAGIEGAFAVTGWALDDVEVTSVTIWRDPVAGEPAQPNGYVYIGDAVFVDGARPDVEEAYPAYPLNSRAGWGYMVLSNFLPNKGNGTFRLHAVAADAEGRTKLLGSRTISCDNAHAVLPFGAIDTPVQGGTVWGNAYVNFGWALTPLPKSIPADGSTLRIWIDGVPAGRPVYNNFRSDIAGLFPGLANSNGAVGHFAVDTTAYEDGLHTIAWSVSDSAGVGNGIGSRYFTVMNAGAGGGMSAARVGRAFGFSGRLSDLAGFEPDVANPLLVRRGYDERPDAESRAAPGRGGADEIEIRQSGRVVVSAGGAKAAWDDGWKAFLVVGDELRPLPVGATFDPKRGVLFWQPGPAFLGEYIFVLVDSLRRFRRDVRIRIIPN